MKITTRVFGTIEIDDDKIIHFPAGIIGFPDMQACQGRCHLCT